MKDFSVSVRKLTDVELMREACESTFAGSSSASLLSLYKAEHSPARTQLFWITLKTIPLFVSTHLIRHHVGSVPFQLTCRKDRDGANPRLPERVDEIVEKLDLLSSHVANNEDYKSIRELIGRIIDKAVWLKDNSDRYTPVNLSLLVNAQSLIDMAKLRLCTGMASQETTAVFRAIKAEIDKIDPELASMMVRKCVYRNGLCGERKCCGFNHTQAFQAELREYASHFTEKQKGLSSHTNQQ